MAKQLLEVGLEVFACSREWAESLLIHLGHKSRRPPTTSATPNTISATRDVHIGHRPCPPSTCRPQVLNKQRNVLGYVSVLTSSTARLFQSYIFISVMQGPHGLYCAWPIWSLSVADVVGADVVCDRCGLPRCGSSEEPWHLAGVSLTGSVIAAASVIDDVIARLL